MGSGDSDAGSCGGDAVNITTHRLFHTGPFRSDTCIFCVEEREAEEAAAARRRASMPTPLNRPPLPEWRGEPLSRPRKEEPVSRFGLRLALQHAPPEDEGGEE